MSERLYYINQSISNQSISHQSISHQSISQQMQTNGVKRGSHCRRKTRPAIAKRYDIDGGCMREYYRMKTTCLRDYTTSINQSLINQSLINQSINQLISHQSINQSISVRA